MRDHHFSKNTERFLRSVGLMSCIVLSILVFSYRAYGAGMTSNNYQIQSDSINFGGLPSSSTNYKGQETIGEVGTGPSSSTNYSMRAGFQQMVLVSVAVTAASNVTMSPSISGTLGGTANGSTSFTVTTDDPVGYTATIQSSNSPALQTVGGAASFADYTPSGANPDFAFSVSSNASGFAYTPEGSDIDQFFKDNGSSCNAGSSDTSDACWYGLSTTPKTILTRTTANEPSGTLTTLKFRAQSGASHTQPSGTYIATTTVTVIAS